MAIHYSYAVRMYKPPLSVTRMNFVHPICWEKTVGPNAVWSYWSCQEVEELLLKVAAMTQHRSATDIGLIPISIRCHTVYLSPLLRVISCSHAERIASAFGIQYRLGYGIRLHSCMQSAATLSIRSVHPSVRLSETLQYGVKMVIHSDGITNHGIMDTLKIEIRNSLSLSSIYVTTTDHVTNTVNELCWYRLYSYQAPCDRPG